MRTKTALILANIGVLPLMTAFGGLNGELLQYYASGYFELTETEIGAAIGLLGFTIPLQLLSTQLVRRWGSRRLLLAGFSIRFSLIPLLLLVPWLLQSNHTHGLLFFYGLIFTVHLVHACTFGVAWQPLVREATLPEERGELFGNMRFLFNGFNFVFFALLGLSVGERLTDVGFFLIVLFLMAYCIFAFAVIWQLKTSARSIVTQPRCRDILSQAKQLLRQPAYRGLIAVSILRLPSTLPLFIVYATLVVGLSASDVSWILAFRATGMMAGFLVWGRIIRRHGHIRAVVWPLVLLLGVGNLWFVFAALPTDYTRECVVALFCAILALTAFAHSGLGLGMVTAVHNTAHDDNAVVSLTLFDILDMGLESLMAAIAGIYIHTVFSEPTLEVTAIAFDPYMAFALVGAALAGIAAVVAKRRLSRPQIQQPI